MKSLLIWIVTALLFTAAGGLVVFSVMRARESGEPEEVTKKTASTETQNADRENDKKERLSRDQAGNTIIHLAKDDQARMGIELKALAEASYRPELIAFGTLQEDPAAAFTLRAPLPGTVRRPPTGHWPVLGETLADNAVAAVIDPRLGPVERADLAARLAAGRADVQQAKASLEAMQAALEGKRRLNAQGKIVSDQALQEAEAQVTGEAAKLKGAMETVRIMEGFLSTATSRPTEALPLVVPTGGLVVDLPVSEGESVESGQAILKIGRFDRLLARISLPAGQSLDPGVNRAAIAAPGHEDHLLPAKRLTIAPAADTVTGGQTFLFSVNTDGAALQPGMSIVAHLQLPGEPRTGVVVPRAAVVRFGGSTWVYVQTAEDRLTRRQAPVDAAVPEGWFVSHGLEPGDQVVVRGAQSVLSEELKFGTEEEEE